MKLNLICIIIALQVGLGLNSKILVFLPLIIRSHYNFIKPLVRELANRGHHVTNYVPYPMEDDLSLTTNYTEILVPSVLDQFFGESDFLSLGRKSAVEQAVLLRRSSLTAHKLMCRLDFVQELLHSDQEFDAVILMSLWYRESFATLAHRFRAVHIDVMPSGNAHWVFEIVGNPYNPAYMVEMKTPADDNMGFADRVANTISSLGTIALEYYSVGEIQRLTDECFSYPGSETRPPIIQLLANTSLLLINTHFAVSRPYPTARHVIDVGGLHITPNKPLPKDIQTLMDEAKDGVIYFSIGSALNMSKIIKGEIFHAFNSAFGKLKQKVLWKWEEDRFPIESPNVKTSKWFPQQDILAHKNCKLFITHAGFHSVSEAVWFGVPLIAIPIFGDQRRNAKIATHDGYAITLELGEVTEEKILWAMEEILSNRSYQEAAMMRSALLKDRPQTPLETATYWTEYVIKHRGASHLKTALSKMPWYQSMLLDVIAFFLSILAIVTVVIYMIVKKFLNYVILTKIHPVTRLNTKKIN